MAAYVRSYAFLSQIIPYADRDMEMLYSFARLLQPHLPKDPASFVKITDEVDLEYYRLERIFSGAINIGAGEAPGVKSPIQIGTSMVRDAPLALSAILDTINVRPDTPSP